MKRPGRKLRWAAALLLLAAIVGGGLSSCATVSPYYDAAKPHRAREGFRNNYDNSDKQSFWRWQLERARRLQSGFTTYSVQRCHRMGQ